MLISLIKTINDEKVEYHMPASECEFSQTENLITIIYNDDEYTFPLEDNEEMLATWLKAKDDAAMKTLSTHSIQEYVGKLVQDTLTETKSAHLNEIETLKSDFQKERVQMNALLDNTVSRFEVALERSAEAVEAMNKMSDKMSSVFDDVTDISGEFKNLKQDFKSVTDIFANILAD